MAQAVVSPEIFPGFAGIPPLGVTVSEEAAPVPQELFAYTFITPLALPMVALIEFVVEVPLNPDGSSHV